jgi:hypothetical protein
MKTTRKPRAKAVPKVTSVKVKALSRVRTASAQNVTLLKAEGVHCFWVNNGPVLADIRELAQAFKSGAITDAQWKHHVRSRENDFANWIQFVFRNPELAKKLRATASKSDAYKVLSAALTK